MQDPVTSFIPAQEAPTPLISNRASKRVDVPSLLLPRPVLDERHVARSFPNQTAAALDPPLSSKLSSKQCLDIDRGSPEIGKGADIPEDPPVESSLYASLFAPTLAMVNIHMLPYPVNGPFVDIILSFFALLVSCDVMKAGLPYKLVHHIIRRLRNASIFQRSDRLLSSSSPPKFGISTSKDVHDAFLAASNSPFILSLNGIPNYGQTCFLNSVLQALASLEPFQNYLERVVRRHEDLSIGSGDGGSCFSFELWRVLRAVNGHHGRMSRRIDTRPLLKAVADSHNQFEMRKMEQQDAEELFVAVMAMTIKDSGLEKLPSAVETAFVSHESRDGNKVEPESTNASGEDPGGHIHQDGDQETHSLVVKNAEEENDSVVAKADPTERANAIQQKTYSDLTSSSTSTEDRSTAFDQPESLKDKEKVHAREEKKQEDFEIFLPRTSSELFMSGEHRTLHTDIPLRRPHMDDSTLSSPASCGSLSLATNSTGVPKIEVSPSRVDILEKQLASISPSPLSGWIGSSIQCCACNHIRPINNVPFLDLPLVPTSVPEYLAQVSSTKIAPVPPSSLRIPPCSLDQCFRDYTSVERVHDVECMSCTINKEVIYLEDECSLLDNALESLERKTHGIHEQVTSLRAELDSFTERLSELKKLNPDDCDSKELARLLQDSSLLDIAGFSPESKKLVRCDAKKCLTITRRPALLCCHIRRRFFDPSTERMEKCNQHVEFPEIFDLRSYCQYSFEHVGGHPVVRPGKLDDDMRYRLMSVIEHRGNAHGGHYVSFRRNSDGEWHRISDSNVTPIGWQIVRSSQAYMLFYEAM